LARTKGGVLPGLAKGEAVPFKSNLISFLHPEKNDLTEVDESRDGRLGRLVGPDVVNGMDRIPFAGDDLVDILSGRHLDQAELRELKGRYSIIRRDRPEIEAVFDGDDLRTAEVALQMQEEEADIQGQRGIEASRLP
jgi:hypothetical protein